MQVARPDLQMMKWNVSLPFSYFKGLLMVNHPPVEGTYTLGWGQVNHLADQQLLQKIIDYVLKDVDKEPYFTDLLVDDMKDGNTNRIHEHMKHMFKSPILNGITQGESYHDMFVKNVDDIRKNAGFAIYDKLFTLMESVGLIPAFSPEDYVQNNNYHRFYIIPVDMYIEKLSKHLDADISAPKYSGDLFGIQTEKYGLYSDRDFMCLGVAIRIAEKYWNKKDISIIDIGGGVGHLSYYLYKLGFKNITTVDVPMVNAFAMHFLGSNLPNHGIKFLSPHAFTGDYDLVINVDGLTQIDKEKAEFYTNRMLEDKTKHFYSVNREIDSFTVGGICSLARVSRTPFWHRRGYVEEDYFGGL